MRLKRLYITFPILLLALATALTGCVQKQSAKRSSLPDTTQGPAEFDPESYKIGQAYQVAGRWYYPKVNYAYRETGIASWYGPGFHGRQTANGEVYDQNDLTAAHRTLPMPSMVRVTNLENGRSIKVRINDRGPFKNGRIIDLSRRGADLLGFRGRGTAKVLVEIIEDESRALATAALSEEAAAAAPDPVPIEPVDVLRLPGLGQGPVPTAQISPKSPAHSQVQTAGQTATTAPHNGSVQERSPLLVPEPDGIVTTTAVKPSQIYVQAGSFARIENAHKLRARLSSLGRAKIAQAVIDKRRYFRVRFGPMGSVDEADKLLALLLDNGHDDARVVID